MAVATLRSRVWRLAAAVLLALLVAAMVFAMWVWWASEKHLASFVPPPPFTAPIPTDEAALAHGARLAVTRGCTGCHGEALHGDVFQDDALTGRAVAANLTTLVRDYGPAVFERAVRHGIGHDGKALYSMPAYNFVRLSDADIAALYAHIRRLPVAEPPLPAAWLGLPRLMIALGDDFAIPAVIPKVPPLGWQTHADAAVRRGEYLAMTSCIECHGLSLRADDPFLPAGETPPPQSPPDLALVASYDKADFIRLMRTGKAAGNRELRLMSGVARGRYAHWTDQEVEDLYAFLSAMGQKAAS